jgi:hypothetical protein
MNILMYLFKFLMKIGGGGGGGRGCEPFLHSGAFTSLRGVSILINNFECRIHMCISFDLFTCVTIGDKGGDVFND